MIVRDHLTVIVIGIVFGVILAGLATRAVSARLFNVSSMNATSFVGGMVVMLCVGLVAVALPAGRATRVDPAGTLRYE